MVQRTCAISGCDAVHYGYGYCRPHYRRFKRYGDPLGWKHQQSEMCEVPGCEAKSWARNLCGSHYSRWRKHGDAFGDKPLQKQGAARQPIVGPPRVRRFCVINGCDAPVKGHGWCGKHYLRWRAHGDPEWQRPTYSVCVVDECEKTPRSAAASLCEAHYMRLHRNGTLEAGQCSVCQEALPRDSTLHRRYCEACNLDRRRVRGRDYGNRRRVAMLSREHEHIDSLEIYERDGWKCRLCYRKVNPKLRWPHPKSASLDHILPIAKGGGHVRTNVHLAHLACNASKRDRGSGEQLMLIG